MTTTPPAPETDAPDATPPIHQLIYASAAANNGSAPNELKRILESARKNNQPLNITGVLLHVEGSFLQVLEGEEQQVMAVFNRIKDDKRHTEVVILWQGEVEQRDFDDWSMGFGEVSRDELADMAGVNDFFNCGKTLAQLDKGYAKRVLAAFKAGKWRRGAA